MNLLWWQQFFQFWNDCGIDIVRKFHIELNDKLSFFERVAVSWHTFTKDASKVTGLYTFAYKKAKNENHQTSIKAPAKPLGRQLTCKRLRDKILPGMV